MTKTFLQACRGEATSHTPIWLNRQAGRYMPEYHEVKGDMPSLDFFKNPERAARATLDAQRILGVDAAILFADLLPILEPMGLRLDYQPGIGPVFENPIRSVADVDGLLNQPAEQATPYIAQTVTNILEELPPEVALIGFAGAPFTLASYAIEGRGSRNYVFVKKLMYEHEAVWHRLLDKLVDQVTSYLQLQIRAGVEAVQLFDTWVGCLSVVDFRRYVLPHTQRLVQAVRICSRTWSEPGPMCSLSTGAFRWGKPGKRSTARRFRATSIPSCSARTARPLPSRLRGFSIRRRGATATSSISGTGSFRKRPWIM